MEKMDNEGNEKEVGRERRRDIKEKGRERRDKRKEH